MTSATGLADRTFRRLTLFSFLTLSLALIHPVSALAEGAKSEKLVVLARGVEPELLETVIPDYPRRALNRETEGWVVILMDIDKEGRVNNPIALESSHSGKLAESFKRTAVNSVKEWRFKPAMVDGLPAERDNMQQMFLFRFPDTQGEVSRSFYARYRKVVDALDSNELEEARVLLDKMQGRDLHRLAESAYVLIMESIYAEKIGDNQKTLKILNQALQIADDSAQPGAYAHLLRMSVRQNALANNFHTALESYATLQEVDENLSPGDAVNEIASRVQAALESDQAIESSGEIVECLQCRETKYLLNRRLNRSRFMVELDEGEIESLRVSCGPTYARLAWSEALVYRIENDVTDCRISVRGTEGSKVRLIELPEPASLAG